MSANPVFTDQPNPQAQPPVPPALRSTPRPQRQLTTNPELVDLPPAMPMSVLLTLLIGTALGAFAAVMVLPTWLPGLSASLLGSEPKVYWYLSRSNAVAAYVLLWLSMIFGLLMTNRMARLWPGGPGAFDLHQHTSLLGLAFALFHGLILLGDRYITATLAQVLTPFAYSGYEPLWVGLGQLSLHSMALVGLSFYVKQWIGRTLWRLIHFLSFAIWLLSLLHALFSGSDTELLKGLYWISGGSVLLLTIYRVLVAFQPAKPRPAWDTTS